MTSRRDSPGLAEHQKLLAVIVKNLHENDAEHIVIGGFAVRQYVDSRQPKDIDIWVNPKGDNPFRVTEALIQSKFVTFDVLVDSPRLWEDWGVVRLKHPETGIRLDVLTNVSGSELFHGFDNAYKNASTRNIDGIEYKFMNEQHLTINKIASGSEERAKDFFDARSLLDNHRESIRENAELKSFELKVRGLCDTIAEKDRERGPERIEKTQQASAEPKTQPELRKGTEPERDREPER